MSSATSTETARASVSGSLSASSASASAGVFRPWHFFVILTLIAATAAVVTARSTSPENLVMLSVTVFAAGAAAIAVYRTLLPLVGRERTLRADTLGQRARVALEREKMLVLRSIKELEFDRAMGKLAESDFHEMSDRLRARAMGLMRQLDATHAAPRERIERELADRLQRDARRSGGRSSSGAGVGTAGTVAGGIGGRGVVGGVASDAGASGAGARAADVAGAMAEADEQPAAAICSDCGTSNDADARFCKECGTKLARGAAHA